MKKVQARTLNRHPASGGYPNGEDTRRRVIDAAIALFSEKGFEGTSTREISIRAKVSPPAIQYYFSNKEGLYMACVDRMIDEAWKYIGASIENLERLLRARASNEALIDAFCSFQGLHAEMLFSSDEPVKWVLISIHEETVPVSLAASEKIRTMRLRALNLTSRVIARLTGTSKHAPATVLKAALLGSQMSGILLTQRTLMAELKWDALTAARLKMIQSTIEEFSRKILMSL